MGSIIKSCQFLSEEADGVLKPIIFCCSGIEQVHAVSLNIPLAEALMRYEPMRRTLQIENCLFEVTCSLPEEVVIKDFDVLFNPSYKIDVLSIMVNVCKKRAFNVVWPGKIEGNKLVYAEEGYKDYKEYDVNNYDVTCII